MFRGAGECRIQLAQQLIVFFCIIDIKERHLAGLLLHGDEVEWQNLVCIHHTRTICSFHHSNSIPAHLEDSIVEEEMVIRFVPALEIWLDNGQSLQG